MGSPDNICGAMISANSSTGMPKGLMGFGDELEPTNLAQSCPLRCIGHLLAQTVSETQHCVLTGNISRRVADGHKNCSQTRCYKPCGVPCSIRRRPNSWQPRHTPSKFTAITRCNSSTGVSMTAPRACPIPALLITRHLTKGGKGLVGEVTQLLGVRDVQGIART
ncbi:MAG: hypothetical protein CM15mP103_01920 [Gammaproteobacteria bacterium]|nr:MAG: hypothetical protein CM15mP103_01920 [Gammaproteobacteria bacterium]